MSSDLTDKLIEKYIDNVESYWIKIKEGNSKEANTIARSNKKIITKWIENGVIVDILTPLLNHSSGAVRLSSAAYLINTDLKDQAVAVLRHLIESDPGFISPSAAGVLRINNIK